MLRGRTKEVIPSDEDVDEIDDLLQEFEIISPDVPSGSSSSLASSSDKTTENVDVGNHANPDTDILNNLLGIEMLMQIFCCLTPREVLESVRLVCKQWNEIVEADSFWRAFGRFKFVDLDVVDGDTDDNKNKDNNDNRGGLAVTRRRLNEWQGFGRPVEVALFTSDSWLLSLIVFEIFGTKEMRRTLLENSRAAKTIELCGVLKLGGGGCRFVPFKLRGCTSYSSDVAGKEGHLMAFRESELEEQLSDAREYQKKARVREMMEEEETVTMTMSTNSVSSCSKVPCFTFLCWQDGASDGKDGEEAERTTAKKEKKEKRKSSSDGGSSLLGDEEDRYCDAEEETEVEVLVVKDDEVEEQGKTEVEEGEEAEREESFHLQGDEDEEGWAMMEPQKKGTFHCNNRASAVMALASLLLAVRVQRGEEKAGKRRDWWEWMEHPQDRAAVGQHLVSAAKTGTSIAVAPLFFAGEAAVVALGMTALSASIGASVFHRSLPPRMQRSGKMTAVAARCAAGVGGAVVGAVGGVCVGAVLGGYYGCVDAVNWVMGRNNRLVTYLDSLDRS